MAFEQIRHPDRFALDPNTYREVVTKGWWKIEEHFDGIEERLSAEWEGAVRSGYSIADIYLLVLWLWGAHRVFNGRSLARLDAANGQDSVSSCRTSRHADQSAGDRKFGFLRARLSVAAWIYSVRNAQNLAVTG
ncbi:hypothetical protein HGP14_31795 [Rhizobium sp. P32RR-XVIII]|uniref:hypothetical protein n=1 Tax=Rhizobium sp. P32RR-XVIII TaxID=2726738 RepID=UPI001456B6A5|nr:hypothetical protein [Rhizobium sp. P32RR-XVIII]NLS07822.1 hypothetical protein [Rhizobium sp. P32RR-XVIII]